MLMIVKRNPKIEEAPLQGELMLFDPASSKFFVLNRSMAFVWRQCEGDRSAEEMAAALVEEFSGVDVAAATTEVKQAIDSLASLGLVESFENATA
jgi:hypothetical protein